MDKHRWTRYALCKDIDCGKCHHLVGRRKQASNALTVVLSVFIRVHPWLKSMVPAKRLKQDAAEAIIEGAKEGFGVDETTLCSHCELARH